MNELFLFFIAAFSMGLIRGASICTICCAPGMIPYIVAKRYNWRQSLRLGLIFSIPRIVVLTILGVIIGYMSFSIVQQMWFQSLVLKIGAFGYFIVGIILFCLGAYMFTTTVDEMADKVEGIDKGQSKSPAPTHGGFFTKLLAKFMGKDASKSKRLFIIWGIAMSVACVAETTFLEGIFLGGIAGIIGTSHLNAAFIGGAVLFFLAIGATIPVLIVVIIGGSLSERIKNGKTMDSIKTIGSIMMLMIGLGFIILNLSNLILYL